MNILVDADGLPYIAGGSGCTRYYNIVYEDEKGNLGSGTLESAVAVKEFVEEKEVTLLDRELVVEPGPLEFALQICKNKLLDIKRRYPKGNLQVYVKGDGTNWRDDVATIAGYKANRTQEKPPWNAEVYQYLKDSWDAIEISGKEVDDHVATLAYETSKPYVICSPDKDLDQIPGTHWNYSKNVEYEISWEEARAFFWQQCLSGDAADNIKGCWKMGEKLSSAMVLGWIAEGYEEEEIWDRVVAMYEASLAMAGCSYTHLTAYEAALENARLVWMQAESGRLWTPPGQPYEYLEVTLDD